jgi:protein phosphatase
MAGKSDDTAVHHNAPPAAEAQRPHPLSALVHFDFAALSHPGKVRPNNEDHYLVARYSRSMLPLQTNLPDAEAQERFDEMGYAMVVADGMGGAAAGEVASSLAITTAVNLSLHNPRWGLPMTAPEAEALLERMRLRIQQINHVLTERVRAQPELSGMGTTLTAAYSVGPELFLCHVGDSRAYLFRRDHLHQLTQDQTLAQALADAGQIRPEEVPTHRLRHVLLSALGGQAGTVKAEIQHLRLQDDDRLLLCTDGLTEMVPDARIAEVLRQAGRTEDACRALLDLALERGGKDNVTLVLARYSIPEPPGAEARPG